MEWSIGKVAGDKEIKGETRVHKSLEKAQQDIAVLPDYSFKKQENADEAVGKVVSGLVGSGITVGLVLAVGYLIKLIKRKKAK